MVNQKNGTSVGHVRFEQNFQQPIGGTEFFGMVPKLPRGDLLERDITGRTDLQEGVASNGVKRLDAAIHKDRQPAKLPRVQLAIFVWLWHEDRDDLGAEEANEKPRDDFK